MKVKIKEKKEIARDALQITFDALGQELHFKAGQFCKVTLLNPPYSDNRGNSRFLGFTTSPSEKGTFSILTKKGVSAFKKSLAQMPIGSDVEISGIDGRINKLPDDLTQPLVFVAEGVGISPLMSILRFCNENSWPYSITLIYSNKNPQSTPFLEELENFAKDTGKFRLIFIMTEDSQWKGEKRNITVEFIKNYFPEPGKNLYAITGAPEFTLSAYKAIETAGVSVRNIKMEIFTGY